MKFSKNLLRYVYSYHFPDNEEEMYETIKTFDLDDFIVYMQIGGPLHLINHNKFPDFFEVGEFKTKNFFYLDMKNQPIVKYKEVYFSYPYLEEIYEKVFNKSSFESRIIKREGEYFLEFKLDDTFSLVLMEMYFLREENKFLDYNKIVPLNEVLQDYNMADDMVL